MTTYTLIHTASLKMLSVVPISFLNVFFVQLWFAKHHLRVIEMDRKARNVDFKGKIETGWLSKEVESEVKTLLACIARFQGYRYQSFSEIVYKVGL
jgi:hypothetical protein